MRSLFQAALVSYGLFDYSTLMPLASLGTGNYSVTCVILILGRKSSIDG